MVLQLDMYLKLKYHDSTYLPSKPNFVNRKKL
jgi:hypothetical protein